MSKYVFFYNEQIDHIENDYEFNKKLVEFLEDFEEKQPPCAESFGHSITTCSDDSILLELDYKSYIIEWFYRVIVKYCKNINIFPKKIFIKRLWCNRVYSGCSVNPHNHFSNYECQINEKDLVIILYYNVDDECKSNMIFVDSDEILDSIDEYSENEKTYIPLQNGLSIIHSSDVIHSVSEHKSNIPRICFVFDIKLVF